MNIRPTAGPEKAIHPPTQVFSYLEYFEVGVLSTGSIKWVLVERSSEFWVRKARKAHSTKFKYTAN